MSIQIITGCREYNFEDETSGREVKGLSVYYTVPLQDDEKSGLKAKGCTIGKLAVKPDTPLYQKMLQADYSQPFEADVRFDILPGSKKPVLESIEILGKAK